jgi:hypothetical protein
MFMVHGRRFLAAYVVLALGLAAGVTATVRLASKHRPGPLAPGAVALVETFLGSIQDGDLQTACRIFSAFPACDPTITPPVLRNYEVQPAEAAVDGVDVPATLNDEYAIFTLSERLGHYRIVDIVADPAALGSFTVPPLVQ